MAVNVAASPSAYNFLNTSIAYTFNMTGIVAGTVTKTFAYRLEQIGVGAVTPDLSYTPEEGVDFDINFDRDVFAVLATQTPINANPLFNSGFIRDETHMIGEFKCVYWEVSFDSEACVATAGATADGQSFFAVNGSVSHYYIAQPDEDFTVLSPRPKQHTLCRDIKDLFYVLSTGGITLGATTYNSDGGAVGDIGPITHGNTSKVMSFNIMPSTPLSDTVEYLCVYIGKTGDTPYTYTIKLKDCCDTHIPVFFQAQHGGYSSMAGRLIGVKPVTKSDEVYRTIAYPDTGRGGVMAANKETYMEYTLEFKALITDEHNDTWFYEQFVSSGHYYLLLPNNYTTDDIPDKTQISAIGSGFTWNRELRKITASFKLHVPNLLPNYYY